MKLISYSFGFSVLKHKDKVCLPSLDWYDHGNVSSRIRSVLSSIFSNDSIPRELKNLLPALPYFLWKSVIWPENYFSNSLSLSSFYNDYTGNSRIVAYLKLKLNKSKRLVNLVVYIHNKVIALFCNRFALIYSIGALNREKFLIRRLPPEYKNKYITLQPFSWNNYFIAIFKMRPTLFLFEFCSSIDLNSNADFGISYLEFLYRESIFFDSIFSWINIGIFLSDDDPSRVYSILLSCRNNRIHTVGYQHGLYSKHEYGYFNKSFIEFFIEDWWFDTLHIKDFLWCNILKQIRPNVNSLVHCQSQSTSKLNKPLLYPDCLSSYNSVVLVLDSYADIKSIHGTYEYILRCYPNTKVWIRPHPSMSKLQVSTLVDIFFPSVNVKKNLEHNHIYLCFKSSLILELMTKDYAYSVVPSRLSYLSDYLDHALA